MDINIYDDIEYKETISTAFLKNACAFANYNGGKIIFGATSEGETVGLSGDLSRLSETVDKMIVDYICPLPPHHISINEDTKTIELIIEEGTSKPYRVNQSMTYFCGLTV